MRSRAARVPVALAAAMAVAAASCGPPKRPGLPPRNVVLVTIGGLRADRLSCYAYERPTTRVPSDETARVQQRAMGLDDLAAAGVSFSNAHAPSTSTVASLATLLTGLPPLAAGVPDDDACLPDEVPSLPDLLAARGWRTTAFVTSPSIDLERALGRGFAEFTLGANDVETLTALSRWLERDFGDGQSFFLWLHLGGLESPWRPQRKPRFAREPRADGDAVAALLERARRGELELDPADARRANDLHDDALAETAENLAWILRRGFDVPAARAETSEVWSRTALVVTSPRGVELPEHGRFGHAGELCDEVLRVPLILRHPDSLTGERVCDEVVELADVAPTLLAWLRIERPAPLPGRSLLDRLDAPRAGAFERRPAVAALPGGAYSVRSERWRLAWNPASEPRCGLEPGARLYDLEADLLQVQDVAASHPAVVAALQRAAARALAAQPQRLPRPCAGPDGGLPTR